MNTGNTKLLRNQHTIMVAYSFKIVKYKSFFPQNTHQKKAQNPIQTD